MGRGLLSGTALLLGLLAVACTPPPAPNAPLAPPVPQLPRAAASPTAVRQLTIGLSLPDASAEPWRSLAYGARDEARRHGVELAMPEPASASPAERQAAQLRELARRRVDFVLVGGGDGAVVAAAADELATRGLPLAGLSSLLSVERLVFRVGPDRPGLGRVQAECLAAAIGGRGAIGLLAGPPSSPAALEQAQAFRETLQRQFPNAQLLVERAASLDRAAAAAEVGSWLERWPTLAAVAASSDETALGALDALAAGGRLGQVRLAVANLGPAAAPALGDGSLHCASLQQAVAEGQAAIRNALAYLAGQPYEKNVKSPPLLVTRETASRFDWSPVRAP